MSTMAKLWQGMPDAPRDYLQNALKPDGKPIDPLIAQLLYRRGVEHPGEFLYATEPDDLKKLLNPACMKNVERAAARITQAISRREKICVYGDFDCDGITSTTLMTQVIRHLGGYVEPYIPDRIVEGYGLNSPALRTLGERDFKLVVTVDCGIRSMKEVNEATLAGMDMVITDHHSVGSEIPQTCVVNPQQKDCGGHFQYRHLAGVGVACMVAIQLLNQNGWGSFRLSNMLDLVAIGTVADVMHLNDPVNRLLVIHGLAVINEGRRMGLRVLLENASLKLGSITSENIGFGIGPRINAAGRLDKGIKAYHLLSATDEAEARRLAAELSGLNVTRQAKTRDAHGRIRDILELTGELDSPLLFAQDDTVEPGIVGLVAGRLTEEFYRPTVILHKDRDESRASCRSIPEFDITNALDGCADLLLRHGGHAMAAGFTVANANVDVLKQRLMLAARRSMDGRSLMPILHYDLQLPFQHINLKMVENLICLEPCGHKNPTARFVTPEMRVVSHTILKDKHLKMKLNTGHYPSHDAIAFNRAEFADDMPDRVDVLYTLSVNEYNGRRNVQMMVEDIRPSRGDT